MKAVCTTRLGKRQIHGKMVQWLIQHSITAEHQCQRTMSFHPFSQECLIGHLQQKQCHTALFPKTLFSLIILRRQKLAISVLMLACQLIRQPQAVAQWQSWGSWSGKLDKDHSLIWGFLYQARSGLFSLYLSDVVRWWHSFVIVFQLWSMKLFYVQPG